MHIHNQSVATKHERHISVIKSIQNRGSHHSNIWIRDSPKNNTRLIIEGDIAFIYAVLLEGDVDVVRYVIDPPPVFAEIDGETHKTTLDAIIYYADGSELWVEFKREADTGSKRRGRSRTQLSAQAQAASQAGMKYEVWTEKGLQGKEILFDNWLTLCAAITRSRNFSSVHEVQHIKASFQSRKAITLGELLNEEGSDPALTLAVLGQLLQRGVLTTELHSEFLSHQSILQRRDQ